jgi:UDP-N-acetylglucosamine/UDP-N-acetylgalactosamine diphosphorylase
MMAPFYQAVYDRYAAAQQEHVLTFYDSLNSDDQAKLLQQLDTIDPKHVNEIFKLSAFADAEARAAADPAAAASSVEPPPPGSVESPDGNPNKAAEWQQVGYSTRQGWNNLACRRTGHSTWLVRTERMLRHWSAKS